MKKLIALSVALGFGTALWAEEKSNTEESSVIAKVFNPELTSEKFQLYLHTKGSLNANISDGNMGKGAFQMEQLRIEMRGDLNEHIYYRYQQRLTAYNDPTGTIDNLPLKVDYAGLGYRFNPQWRLFAGKMCTAYGSFEFDDNPINVYQYSTIHENMIAFLTGVDLTYDITPAHELRLQVLDARNESMEKTYGKIPTHIKENKLDLVYTLNWNGHFGPDNRISTRWSASVLNEAKQHNMYYVALGTALNLPKFGTFLDLMYSREELDRKQILSGMLSANTNGFTLTDVDYKGVILGMNYRFAPKWNLAVKGIVDVVSKYKAQEGIQKGNYRNTFSYTTALEYYPLNNKNLHLNLAYTGRKHQFSTLGKEYGLKNYAENKLELSFIYALRIF